MNTFVLILTLTVGGGYSVATAEFDGLYACENAGMAWKKSLTLQGLRGDLIRYLCVPCG